MSSQDQGSLVHHRRNISSVEGTSCEAAMLHDSRGHHSHRKQPSLLAEAGCPSGPRGHRGLLARSAWGVFQKRPYDTTNLFPVTHASLPKAGPLFAGRIETKQAPPRCDSRREEKDEAPGVSQGWVKTRENREHYEGSPGLCVLWVDTESQKQNFTENPREYQGGQLSKKSGRGTASHRSQGLS